MKRTSAFAPNLSRAPLPGWRPVAWAACLMFLDSTALALPQGPQVVTGLVSVKPVSPGQLLVQQGSQKAIVNWDRFSVSVGEWLRIQQPNSSAVLLNRVVGIDASALMGQISANGRVFLINPNGIVFGKGSRVDAGGFMATTLGMTDADFMAGRYVLSAGKGTPGRLVADGDINVHGGTLALVSPQLSMGGRLQGQRVGLAAAERVQVDVEGDGLIFFNVANNRLDARLDVLGQVQAQGGGTVDMRAQARAGFADTVLNMSGVVQARSLGMKDGQVVIDGGTAGVTQVRGSIDASGRAAGETGGEVDVLGHHVGLFDNARIDASGTAGGGVIHVGGGFQGKGESHNADAVFMGTRATIAADALEQGHGGEVVLWSETSTKFGGHISAQGGAQGGDGGLIETSAKGALQVAGQVVTSGPKGRAGLWLIDPSNVRIVAGGGNNDIDDSVTAGQFVPTANGAVLGADLVTDHLRGENGKARTDVSITTSGAGTQAGNLTVESALTWSNQSSLSLFADNNLTVSATVSNAGGTGNITLRAGANLTLSNAVTAGGALALNFGQSGAGGTLSVNATAAGATITALGGAGNDTLTFGTGIAPFAGSFNGAGGTNTLGVSNGDRAFAITAANTGSLAGATSFTSIQVLQGGSGNDSFTFDPNVSSFGGTLNGGGGSNTLNAANGLANTWQLSAANAGTLNTSTVFSGIQTIIGSSGVDSLTGLAAGSTYTITGDKALTVSGIDFSGVESVTGGAGNDSFTFDAGLSSFGGTLNGGGGNNTLAAANGLDNSWQITAANAGTLNTNTIFASIQTVTGSSGVDSLSGLAAGSAYTITGDNALSVSGIAFSGLESVTAGAGSDSLTGVAAARAYTITGPNALSVSGIDFSGFESVTGGAGNDSFTFDAGLSSFGGTLNGGGGNNTLNAANGLDNTWQLSAANAGTLNTSTDFSGIQTIIGGSGIDSLSGLATASAYTITGSKAFSVSGIDFSGFESVTAGAGNDSLSGVAAGSSYSITGANALSVSSLAFSGIESVTGGAGNDSFTFDAGLSSFGGTLNGGGGSNTLNAANGLDNAWQLSAANAGTLNTSTVFSGIQTIVGSSGVDSLSGLATASAYTISGSKAFSVSGIAFSGFESVTAGAGNDSLSGVAADSSYTITGANALSVSSLAFSGIESVTGGAGNDSFTFDAGLSSFGGTLNGGGGSNTLNAANALDNTWLLTANNAGTLNTSTVFANIQTVVGSSGVDSLTGVAAARAYTISGPNALSVSGIGFSGIESVTGGAGNDSFTFDAGLSSFGGTLNGGGGNNTLNAANGLDNTWQLSAANAGTLNTSTVFSGIQTIVGSSGVDSLSGLATASAYTITGSKAFSVSGIAFSGFESVTAGAGNDSLSGVAAGSSYTITGANALSVSSLAFSGFESVTGGAGNDSFTFDAGLSSFGGTLNGGGGSNTLNAANGLDNAWQLSAANAGTLNTSTVFSGIQTIVGSSGVDSLSGLATASAYTITGSKAFSVSGIAFSGFESVTAGAGNDSLSGVAAGSSYAITGANALSVSNLAFSGIESVTGGAGNDSFTFDAGLSSFGGTLNGGGGSNTLNAANGLANTWQLTAANAGTLNASTIFSSIQTITGSSGADSLTGLATASTYTITGDKALSVSGLAFSGIESVTGGAGNDSFTLNAGISSFGGTLNGGGGSNTLASTSGATYNWQITGANAGTLNTTSAFSSMQTVSGGTGVDNFTGAGGSLAGTLTDAAGSAGSIAGTIQTTGSQRYQAATTLAADATLSSTAGDVRFDSTLNGANDLSINTGGSGTTRFIGVVGGTTALASLSIGSSGSTIVTASQVRTTGDQTWGNALTAASGSLVASAGDITASQGTNQLSGTISATGQDVSLRSAGSFTAALVASGNATLRAGASLGARGTVGGNLTTTSGTSTALGALSVGGAATMAAPGGITQSGNLSVSGTLAVDVDSGTVTLDRTGNNLGTVAITQAGTATITDANSMTVGASVVGSTLTLSAPGTITLSGPVSGGAALVKQGNGTMVVASAQAYTGGTQVNAGTVAVQGSGTLGSGVVDVATGATLDLRSGAAMGNDVTLGGGRLITSAGEANLSGDVTLGANTTVDVASGSTLTLGGSVGDGAASLGLTKSGAGTLALAGSASFDGAFTVSSGLLEVGSSGVLNSQGALVVAAAGSVALDAAQSVGSLAGAGQVDLQGHRLTVGVNNASTTFSGDLLSSGTASGGLTKVGSGTLTLAGRASQEGTTDVLAGTLTAASTQALNATGAVNLAAGATLDLDADATAGGLSGAGAVKLDSFSLSVGGNQASTSFSGTLSSDAAGQLLKQGSGTLSLSGSGAAAGQIGVQSGTLVLASSGAAGSMGVQVDSGATLALQTGAAVGSLAGAGEVQLGSFSLQAGANNASTTFSGQLNGDAASSLVKTGTGTLTLGGSNTVLGTTRASAGVLNLEGGAAIADSAILSVDSGARVNLVSSETVGALSGAGEVTLPGSTLSTGANDASASFSGVISGDGGLTKVGSSVQVLSGNNSYTGTTTVSAGTLQVGAGGSTGTLGSGAVVNQATLSVNRSDAITLTNAISGGGQLVLNQGTLTLSSAANSYTGDTLVRGGQLRTEGAERLPDATDVVVSAPGSLVLGGSETVASIDAAGSVTAAGSITTAGDQTYQSALILNGTGGQTLSGEHIVATGVGNDLGSLPVSITARRVDIATDKNLVLGDVSLIDGGSIDAAHIRLSGDLTLQSGRTTLRATGQPVDSEAEPYGDGAARAPVAGTVALYLAQRMIEQDSGSTINVNANAALDVAATQGGSISLTSDANRFDGSLSVLSGPRFGTAWLPTTGKVGARTVVVQSMVDLAGATVQLGGGGIEGDLVQVRADRLSTPGASVITARLPYDNAATTDFSAPGLTLILSDQAYTLADSFGGAGNQALSVSVGSSALGGRNTGLNAGYVTIQPKGGARGRMAVFLRGEEVGVQGTGSYVFFYDGRGLLSEVPVVYNGLLPETPQSAGALSSVAAISEEARRERFEETVRTENVSVRLRSGVIAEVGPGSPATTGTQGAKPPEICSPGAALACEEAPRK